jgi:hypothetical protein
VIDDLQISDQNKGILTFGSSILILFLSHLLGQLLKYGINYKCHEFYSRNVKPWLGPPRVSLLLLMGFLQTSMMLTYNLDLFFDTLATFLLKTLLMAFWFTLVFIFPLLVSESRDPFLKKYMLVLDSIMAYFAGIAVAFGSGAILFCICGIFGFLVLFLFRVLIIYRQKSM